MQKLIIPTLLTMVFGIVFITSPSCNQQASTDSDSVTTKNTPHMKELIPERGKPAWAKDITAEMQTVIEKLEDFNAPPLVKLSATEARKQPSPADAAMEVMIEHSIPMPPNN